MPIIPSVPRKAISPADTRKALNALVPATTNPTNPTNIPVFRAIRGSKSISQWPVLRHSLRSAYRSCNSRKGKDRQRERQPRGTGRCRESSRSFLFPFQWLPARSQTATAHQTATHVNWRSDALQAGQAGPLQTENSPEGRPRETKPIGERVSSVKTGKAVVGASNFGLYTSNSAEGRSCKTKPIRDLQVGPMDPAPAAVYRPHPSPPAPALASGWLGALRRKKASFLAGRRADTEDSKCPPALVCGKMHL
jgi:hypothetical protein